MMGQSGGWRGRAGIVVVALALALGACGTPRQARQAAVPAEEPPAVPTLVDEAPARSGVLPEAERLAAASPLAVAVPLDALPGPERLAGMTAADLSTLLGDPSFMRRDPPAEIWQYGTETCVLDLFLYADAGGGPSRVSHFEFRGRTVAGVAPRDCYSQLLAVRARRPAG